MNEKLKEILSGSIKVSVRNGAKMELFIYTEGGPDAERMERKIEKLLKDGGVARYPDGSEVWLDVRAVWNSETKDYEWHKDGNRVRVEHIRRTRKNDEISDEVIKRSWRNLENV